MKKLTCLLFVFILLATSVVYSQDVIRPIWTTHHVGKDAIYSPDGTKILTRGGSGVSVWNADNGVHMFTLTGHKRNITKAKFSTDGKKILTCGSASEIVVWSAETGKEEFKIDENRIGSISPIFADADLDYKNENIVFCDESLRLGVINILTGQTLFTKNYIKSTKVKFSPNGQSFLAVHESSVGVYNASTGELLAQMIANGQLMNTADFDKTGQYILTGSADFTARIWEAATGTPVSTFDHGAIVYNTQYTQDGERILTDSHDGLIKVWNLKDNKTILHLNIRPFRNSDASISPDGTILATVHYSDTSTIVWDVITRDTLHHFKGMRAIINKVNFNADQSRIMLSCEDGTTRVYDIKQDYKELFAIRGHAQPVRAQFHPLNIDAIMTSDLMGCTNVWSRYSQDIINTSPQLSIAGLGYGFDNIGPVYNNTGEFLLSFSRKSNKPFLWDVLNNKIVKFFDQKFSIYYNALAISPDGEFAAISGENLRIFSVKTGGAFTENSGGYSYVQFNNSGTQLLALGDNNRTVRIIDVQTGKITTSITSHTDVITTVKYSSDYNYILSTSADGSTRIWNATNGQLITKVKSGSSTAQFNRSGSLIITTTTESAIIWDVKTGKKVSELNNKPFRFFRMGYFLDNDKYVATNGPNEGDIDIWDISTGTIVKKLVGHTNVLTEFIVHPDGKTLLTSSFDGTAKVWDISPIVVTAEEHENNQEPIITLSPNPTTGNIAVSASSTSEKQYSIINQFGEKVLAGLLPGSVNSHTIETSVLPSGMYLFVYDINGKTHQQKFIVNK